MAETVGQVPFPPLYLSLFYGFLFFPFAHSSSFPRIHVLTKVSGYSFFSKENVCGFTGDPNIPPPPSHTSAHVLDDFRLPHTGIDTRSRNTSDLYSLYVKRFDGHLIQLYEFYPLRVFKGFTSVFYLPFLPPTSITKST